MAERRPGNPSGGAGGRLSHGAGDSLSDVEGAPRSNGEGRRSRAEAPGAFFEALARRRVALGFLCGIAALWLAAPTSSSLLSGAIVAIVGEALRIWAAGHLHKSEEVTASGPYRLFAHPLYVGSSILGVGFAIASRSGAAAAIVVVYLGFTLTAAVWTEEARLRARFGAEYDRFKEGRASESSSRPFSLARAWANREHRALAGVVLVWLLLLTKATYNGAFG